MSMEFTIRVEGELLGALLCDAAFHGLTPEAQILDCLRDEYAEDIEDARAERAEQHDEAAGK